MCYDAYIYALTWRSSGPIAASTEEEEEDDLLCKQKTISKATYIK